MEQIKGRKISLLAFDVDGTLLNSKAELNPRTVASIRGAMERGVKVTLTSGRVPPMLEVFVHILNIDGPYVAGNGALIIDSKDNGIIFEKAVDPRELKELCEFCNRLMLHFSLHTKDILYYTSGNPRVYMLERYNRICRDYGFPVSRCVTLDRDLGNYISQAAYKVIVQTPDDIAFHMLREFLDEHRAFEYTFSMKGLLDITAKGIDKGNAVKIVAGYYGIPMNEVCAFGDYDNDIRIFEAAGTGIAMGNACSALKSIAGYVTASNDDDGIAKAISAMWNCF